GGVPIGRLTGPWRPPTNSKCSRCSQFPEHARCETNSIRREHSGGGGLTMTSTQKILGSVVSLWRYPVKSMMGEELNAAEVTKVGLLGDRAYALIDSSEGRV